MKNTHDFVIYFCERWIKLYISFSKGLDHTEEYQSLCVRCEAVSLEIEDIEQKMRTFDQNINEEEQQIKNIASAQDKINVEIQNLQVNIYFFRMSLQWFLKFHMHTTCHYN